MITTRTAQTDTMDLMGPTLRAFCPKPWGSAPHAGGAALRPVAWSTITTYWWQLTLALTFLVPLALAEVSDAAGLVFSDNFEDGTTNKWLQDSPHNKCPVVTAALDNGPGPRSGTKMMRCNWNGGSYDGVMLNAWEYTNEFLLRFWYRVDRDVDAKVGSKMLRLAFSSQQETYWATQFEQLPNAPMFMYWKTPSLDETYWPGSASAANPAMGDYRWHKFELYMKRDTSGANGIIRVWFDGVNVYDRPNILSHVAGSSWGPLYVMSNWSMNAGWEHDANNHVYWDDVEIYSDTRSGAVGSMADATMSSSGAGSPTIPNTPLPPQVTAN